MDLSGACAVVTGAGHGIGRALAEVLAQQGANVVVADIDLDRAGKVADRLGGKAVHCDVADPGSVQSLISEATYTFGPVKVLCSNAGITDESSGLTATIDQMRRIVDVNLLAHVWGFQAVIPQMLRTGGGYLVQTISSAALITAAGAGYTMTKRGALGFAEWVRLNYGHRGVVVTCLCPSAVNTGMLGRNEDLEGAAGAAFDEQIARSLGDVVEPERCAQMTIEAMAAGRFLVLPHPQVAESFRRKAEDYDAWLDRTALRRRRMRGEAV